MDLSRIIPLFRSLRPTTRHPKYEFMSQQLCLVCRTISSDFWSVSYDLFEYCNETKAKVQSYRGIQQQSKKGCHFCTLLLGSLAGKKVRDEEGSLYLWRSYSEPDRAFCIGYGRTRESLGVLYFSRVPKAWCATPAARLGDSIDNVHLMKTWLQKQRLPDGADMISERRFLPTRLLDVLAFPKGNDIRLAISRDLRTIAPPFCLALSHCWGGNVPVQLKRENLKSWSTGGIGFKSLPKTFRDAVEITRQLGCRYLWIDSMCIVQDSESDWKQEASLMAEVYGNARCTLAALSSKNSSEGCHLNASIQTSLKNPFIEIEAKAYRTSRVRVFQNNPRSWIDEYNGQISPIAGETESPLRTRAWVLQEKELSNCTIYFAKGQLLWENGLERATAQVPWQVPDLATQSKMPRLMRQNRSCQIVAAPQYPWYELVEDYTARSLTVPRDKLVAFSGLAKKFGNDRKHYCAGLWSTDLPAALLWRVKDNSATRPAYLAPWWSWASLMGSVLYDSLSLESETDSTQYEFPEDISPPLETLRVSESQIVLADKDKPYGDVQEGKIILSGARCIKVDCSSKVDNFPEGGQPLIMHQVPIGLFYPDVIGETAQFSETYCIAIQTESVRSSLRHEFRLKQDSQMISMVMGIVVSKLPYSQAYRRIGLARWIDESLFEGMRAMTIELV